MRNNAEHYEQARVVSWAKINETIYPELFLLYAIPNAGKRTPRQGAWLKAEGLKAGVPDICLPVARGKYHSIYIEQKVDDGRLQPQQKTWLKKLADQGNYTCASWSSEETIKILKAYLALTPESSFDTDPIQTQ